MPIFKKYLNINGIAELKQFFIDNGSLKEYKKDEFFVNRGQNHSNIGFIIEGGFRYLGYSQDGKDHIVGYSLKNDFVVDYATFQIQEPTVVDIQSIGKSSVYSITHNEFNFFLDSCGIANLRSKLAEDLLNNISTRLLSMYCDSPEERYKKLIYQYPDILNIIHLKEIASLINVTPETLSRIRKKISQHPIP